MRVEVFDLHIQPSGEATYRAGAALVEQVQLPTQERFTITFVPELYEK